MSIEFRRQLVEDACHVLNYLGCGYPIVLISLYV
ncbi:hypothetical protein DES34_107279 [Brevibacillus brevis]|nr:hypothetical protein DES34_107279 [Brevibacillus brevis]TQK61951.1 hypothetical protein FB479_10634 [Brevibacillus sp. AG162]VEF91477.1 Uncharacterised protein [Brevibacillus brevis]